MLSARITGAPLCITSQCRYCDAGVPFFRPHRRVCLKIFLSATSQCRRSPSSSPSHHTGNNNGSQQANGSFIKRSLQRLNITCQVSPSIISSTRYLVSYVERGLSYDCILLLISLRYLLYSVAYLNYLCCICFYSARSLHISSS